MSVHVSPEKPPHLRRRDRGFLTRNPWGVRRDGLSRVLIWLPLGLFAYGLARTATQTSLLVLGGVVVLLGVRLLVEVRREARRGWVVVSRPDPATKGEPEPREPVWQDPSGEWVPARDGLWRPVRVVIALVPVVGLAAGLVGDLGTGYAVGWLVAWPAHLYLFRHVPTGAHFDVAYHCAPCAGHGSYRLCRRCGRESTVVRPPTDFGSLRRRWRSL